MVILLVSRAFPPLVWITQLGFNTSGVHSHLDCSTFRRDNQMVSAYLGRCVLVKFLSPSIASNLFAQNRKGEAPSFLVSVPNLIHVNQLPI